MMKASAAHRVFKSAWFAKAARKAHISDADLCQAIQQVIKGQADDLGGGVFKKRVNNNMHRSIILARAGSWWIYQYLFAKKDRDNIDDAELQAFRKLAVSYSGLTPGQLDQLISTAAFVEICHDR
jgi:hypothetical protein